MTPVTPRLKLTLDVRAPLYQRLQDADERNELEQALALVFAAPVRVTGMETGSRRWPLQVYEGATCALGG